MADENNQELIDRIEKLEKINSELKEEKTELKAKYKGVDVDEFLELKKRFGELEQENTKLEKQNSTLTKDLEATSKLVAEKEGSLSKLLIDDGIAKSLNGLDKHKLNDGALELATLAIKAKGVELVDGVAMVGEKPLNDFITNDWLNDPASRNLVTPNENSGGGAGGGNNNGAPTVGKLDGTKEEQEAYIASKFNL